ncbi:MAG: hydrogenase maturation nickel metallochaperone HypA [Actinobacteria bacterium]|nr:hydrogenase maturation nickel metallochaperone HypA [Actinomycetota bacterium]
MHEYSITISIIEILRELISEKKISKIEKVNFEISPVAHIEPGSIEFYFECLTSEDPVLGNAKLLFNTQKTMVSCMDCKEIFESEKISAVCPRCGGSNTKIVNTDDIRIVSVEGS